MFIAFLVSIEIFQISTQGQKLNTFIEYVRRALLAEEPDTDKDRKCFAQKTLCMGYCMGKGRRNFPKIRY